MTPEEQQRQQMMGQQQARGSDIQTGQPATPPARPVAPVEPETVVQVGLRWEGSQEAQDKLVDAWAKASLNFEEIDRDATGQIGNRNFKYAPLLNLVRATRKALASEGIVVSQPIVNSGRPGRSGRHRIVTVVMGHGAKMVAEMDFTPPESKDEDKRDSNAVTDVKEWGKLTTYYRRYHYQTVFTLDADVDADQAPEGEKRPEPRREPATRPAPHQPPAQQPRPRAEASPPAPGQSMPRDGAARGQQVGAGPQPSGNGSQPPPIPADAQRKPQEAPVALAVPQAIKDLLDSELAERLKAVSGNLGFNRTQATEFCIKVTGKEARNLDRGEQEILLTAAEAEYRSQTGGKATQ